ncbi:acyltransferase [Dapis sp. BLCC M126]|uniref:acyltransferase n=1 Tax=Dapis sp. BLCC M126 TaxID=3400189 RepID=UPI003CFB4D43
MQLPPLQPITNIEPFVSGDVKIDPSVAIAPGVIIQAADNCQIIIAAGVCIGMGAIIHAYQGNIEIESGVTIGSGVLLVGKSKIGANACVGALATIIEQDLEPDKVVLPTSIIGNSGRKILDNNTFTPIKTDLLENKNLSKNDYISDEINENNYISDLENTFSSPEEIQTDTEQANTQLQSVNTSSSPEEIQTDTEQANTQLQSASTSSSPEETQADTEQANTQLQSASTSSSSEETQTDTEQANTQLQEEASPNIDPQIYGKEYVNQIMKTLFPHKNSLSSHPDDED